MLQEEFTLCPSSPPLPCPTRAVVCSFPAAGERCRSLAAAAGAEPALAPLCASSFHETNRNAKRAAFLCAWKTPLLPKATPNPAPGAVSEWWVRRRGHRTRMRCLSCGPQVLSTKLTYSSSCPGLERNGQGSHKEPRLYFALRQGSTSVLSVVNLFKKKPKKPLKAKLLSMPVTQLSSRVPWWDLGKGSGNFMASDKCCSYTK